MTAKDSNNKTIREADWISYGGRIYQVHNINKTFRIGGIIHCTLWFQYIKKFKKVKVLKNPLKIEPTFLTKVDPPIAYNITDNE